MGYRIFAYSTAAALALFLVFNAAVWKLATERLLTGKTGDLSRLSYDLSMAEPKETVIDLPKRHIEGADYRGGPIDMLVIGDSFSNGGSGGTNPFYQDYIATVNKYTVLNIQEYKKYSPLTTIYILLNSGWLDALRPKYVLVEAAERFSVINLGGTIGVSKTDYIENIDRFYRTARYENAFQPGDLAFINSGNAKFFLYKLLYGLSNDAFFSQACSMRISAPLFSKGDGRRLLFHKWDLKAVPFAREDYIRRMNDNLNALSLALRRRGIYLVFMPAVDKYDLYSDYITSNPYPRHLFFELLRALPKDYIFIDTKAILSEELRRGETDVFSPDDTHWSWKASKRIFETVRFN